MSKNRKNSTTPILDLRNLIGGYVPRHDTQMEEAILGAIMSFPQEAIYEVIDVLKPQYFYIQHHQLIYTAILECFNKSHAPDTISVINQLRLNGALETVGGAYAVTRMTNLVTNLANLQAHARIVTQYYMAREMATVCAQDLVKCFDWGIDVFDLLLQHQRNLDGITMGIVGERQTDVVTVMRELQKRIELGYQNEGMTGIPTGNPMLDQLTGGYQPGNLTLVAGRTRHGKSAYAIAKMHFLTKIMDPAHDPENPNSPYSLYPCLLLSMEMPQAQVGARLLSAELVDMGHHIHYSHIERGLITEKEYTLVQHAMSRMEKRGIYVDPSTGLNIQQVRQRVTRHKKKYGVQMVIVDYIQYMTGDSSGGNNLPEQISQNTRGLKGIAKDEDISMMGLSQVSRDTEKNSNRMPGLSDLKGSSGLEESADLVELLYRPEVNEQYPTDEVTGESLRGILMVDLAKNKQGKTEKIKIPFDVSTNSFGNYDAVISHNVAQYMESHKDHFKTF